MNASNASEASCEFTPTPAPATADLYKNDERESELFRILATIIVFVSWVYLIVKAYIDYEANRAEFLEIELRNEVEGDHGLHDVYNNANDQDPAQANDVPAIGPVQLQPNPGAAAAHASTSAEAPSATVASLVARQTSPERRRRQRSSDVTGAASSDQDDASYDDVRLVGSSADTDVAAGGKPKTVNPLRHVRKYARVLNPEDNRSREPETSNEDHAPPSNDRFKPEAANAHAPTDERDVKPTTTMTVAKVTQTETLQLVGNKDASTTAVEECDAGTQTAPDVPALQLEQRLAECAEQPLLANDPKPDAPEVPAQPSNDNDCCQVIPIPPSFQPLPLEKDPPTSQLEKLERGATRIAALNRHGTTFDEDLIADAVARTKRNTLEALKRGDDSKTMPSSSSSSSPSHRIIDSLNASLLEQLAIDLTRRMAAEENSDEGLLRKELESQTRARRESQRTYADVVQQVKWFGLGWESARQEAEKENDEENQRRITREPEENQRRTTREREENQSRTTREREENQRRITRGEAEKNQRRRRSQTILDTSCDAEDASQQGKTAADTPSDEQIVREPDQWKLKKQN